MKDKNGIFNKLSSDGFTLVEVIVSMTLLVIVAGILLTGVMTSGAINTKSTDLTNEGYRLAALLEEKEDGEGDEVSITISGENEIIFVSGVLLSEYNEEGVGFTMFVPGSGNSGTNPGGEGVLIGENPKYAINPDFTLNEEYFDGSSDNGKLAIDPLTLFHHNGNYYITRSEETEFEPGKKKFDKEVDDYIKNKEDDKDEPNAVKINMKNNLDNDRYLLSPDNSFPKGMKPGTVVKVITKNEEEKLFVCFPEDLDDWKKEWRETIGESDWGDDWKEALEDNELADFLEEFFVEITHHDISGL